MIRSVDSVTRLWLSVGLFSRKTSKQEDAQVLKAQDAKEKVKWSKRPASE